MQTGDNTSKVENQLCGTRLRQVVKIFIRSVNRKIAENASLNQAIRCSKKNNYAFLLE